jgi:hypothetical protein
MSSFKWHCFASRAAFDFVLGEPFIASNSYAMGSAVPIVRHPMRLKLGLEDASRELLNSLRYRFTPDCPASSWGNSAGSIILDNLPIKYAERYPAIIRKIVDRQVALPLGNARPFEQFEKYRDGKHLPAGVTLEIYMKPEILRIRSEILQALHGLSGIETINIRECLYFSFSRPQTSGEARETAEALKAAFPKGISLGLADRLTLLQAVEEKFAPTYRGDFYFKEAKKDVKYE